MSFTCTAMWKTSWDPSQSIWHHEIPLVWLFTQLSSSNGSGVRAWPSLTLYAYTDMCHSHIMPRERPGTHPASNGQERKRKWLNLQLLGLLGNLRTWRGRPKKPLPLSKVEQQQRQQKANFRERKRMLELNRLFKELKKTLPRNYQILCKKDILIQVSLHP